MDVDGKYLPLLVIGHEFIEFSGSFFHTIHLVWCNGGCQCRGELVFPWFGGMDEGGRMY